MSHADHGTPEPAGGGPARRLDALIGALERAGLASEAEVERTLERFLAGATPANGARLVARAWLDPGFKARLLADANTAIGELGIDLTHWSPVKVRAVENTAHVHNVIVCTLCSCYPIALLGPSPAWYKSEAYRSRVVREPRAVLREFGCLIADDVRINVWDSTADLRYFVIPRCPIDGPLGSEAELARLVSRNALIGVAPAGAAAPTDRSTRKL